jgi:hypothetical protein
MIKIPSEQDNQSKISSSWSKCVFFWVRSSFGYWIYQVMMGRYWLLIEGVGGTEWKVRLVTSPTLRVRMRWLGTSCLVHFAVLGWIRVSFFSNK